MIQASSARYPAHPKSIRRRWLTPRTGTRANETCLDLLEEVRKDDGEGKIPGLTIEKVTGVMAAMSPRMRWDRNNVINCEKILKKWADPEFRALPQRAVT